MATIKRFEDLEVWQLARELSSNVEMLITERDFKRNFTLVNQMRDSSGSTMDNIAEGFEREGNKEFTHFLTIAKGSNGELRSQLYRARDNNYITKDDFEFCYNKSETLGVKLKNFITYLLQSDIKGQKFKTK